jgi:hypothetical protein
MFKRFRDFAGCDTKTHPGQPIHCDRDFDVWQDKSGEFVVYPKAGEPMKFPTMEKASNYAFAELKAEATAAQADPPHQP